MQHRIRRSDGKYLSQEEAGGFIWVDDPGEAILLPSEAEARQIIVLISKGIRLPLEPVPVGTENGSCPQ
jgi:hypothetical protein